MKPDFIEVCRRTTRLQAVWIPNREPPAGNTGLQRARLRLARYVDQWARENVPQHCEKNIFYSANEISVIIWFTREEELLAFYTVWA